MEDKLGTSLPSEVQVQVELIPATPDHRPALSNLLQLYMHDFGEFVPLELGPDGRFDYPPVPLYWSDPSRFPLLATVDGQWAGFVFVRQLPHVGSKAHIWDMAEFFVLRGLRHRRIGTWLAHRAFERFHGLWQVRVVESNSVACRFWRVAIESFTPSAEPPESSQIDGYGWNIFRFESPSAR